MQRRYHERLKKKAFRMGIVLLLRDLCPAERAQRVKELTEKEFDIPYSRKKTLSRSVIYLWVKEYREVGGATEVLLPKKRADQGVFRRLSEPQKAALYHWRFDNEYRTVAELREELLAHETTSTPVHSPATIARFLRSIGLDRQTLRQARGERDPIKVRLAYEADYPQCIWQADTKGPDLYVQNPGHPGEVVLAKLILFIDDYSRFCPAFAYVLEETESAVMLLFRQAIARFGVPETLYLDRGGSYMGKALEKACALVGCKVIHTAPRDAPAKGKVEKKLRHVYEKLETELLKRDPLPNLDEANEYLGALICQDYHHRVHSVTGQMPDERFFNFPPECRRFISEKALSMIFLPLHHSSVSKTGEIRLLKKTYLVPDVRLYKQRVDVRYDPLLTSKVYVWFKDEFFGEANLHISDNNYLRRQELQEQMQPPQEPATVPVLPDVPPYGYLERKLATYRMEVAKGLALNEELAQARMQKEHVRAALSRLEPPVPSEPTEKKTGEFSVSKFIYLLSLLLKWRFAAHERLLINTAWQVYGPFTEDLVRKTVGRLLGESHPASDLSGFLDAMRRAAESWPPNS